MLIQRTNVFDTKLSCAFLSFSLSAQMQWLLSTPQLPELVGGKAANLSFLFGKRGLRIPQGFAIPASYSALSEHPEQNQVQELKVRVEEMLESLSYDSFAVRSSGLNEDGAAFSFAGQNESFLFVPKREVWQRVCQVWESVRTARAKEYANHVSLNAVEQIGLNAAPLRIQV
jgi:phosphoenolpyruvate synthase/pyruvate phosphate dikinase